MARAAPDGIVLEFYYPPPPFGLFPEFFLSSVASRTSATIKDAMPTATSAATLSTAGTVSSPLNLDAFTSAKGEHETVRLNGSSKKIRPKPKVTLTSLTLNNVGLSDDR